MTATGFLEQKPRSPTGFGLVLLLHGAAIAGVVMIKGPEFIGKSQPIDIIDIRAPEPPPPPDPIREEVETETLRRQLPSPPQREVDTPVTQAEMTQGEPTETYTRTTGTSEGTSFAERTVLPIERPRPAPVRTEALFDSRGGDQQPPYPVAELRAEREGNVRVQVRIGIDGRVKAISRLSATSDAFWRATERHALARWRFRPATEDGRPVESSKTLTVHFRLDGS
ncbi:MAG: TonB family protein [Allosphingosinicella sp.]|uniref:energy transducer TonB n=1 Tax=Allosphingosinicella sp. TaxID=2823234 RepID=UPI003962C5D9